MPVERPRRKPAKAPGEPFIPLSEAEAEWLVLHGWGARLKRKRHRPPPPAEIHVHEVSDEPGLDPIEKILARPPCRGQLTSRYLQ